MKSIDEKIARSEAEWRKYRFENTGVRESARRILKAFRKSGCSLDLTRAVRLFYRALKKSILRRIRCVRGNLYPGMKKTVFEASYDGNRKNTVVSLTSTKGRIGSIFPTLYSLALQSRKPDLIVLWLGDASDYPPQTIARIKSLGITVKYVKDLGPNTKYRYAFAEYKKDVVITVDDDMIYHRDMIKELVGTYRKHPGAVTARRVHKIRFNRDRQPVRYKDWIWEYKDSGAPAHDLFATGVGGVLYPPLVMALPCWENRDFLEVAPGGDDIWMKFCELKNGIRVCAVRNPGYDKDAANLRMLKSGLSSENLGRGRNDRYIGSCAEYFGFTDDLCERVLGEE